MALCEERKDRFTNSAASPGFRGLSFGSHLVLVFLTPIQEGY